LSPPHPLRGLGGRLHGSALDLYTLPDADLAADGRWRALVYGPCARLDRLAGAHGLQGGPAALLLQLAQRAGAVRAIEQLEGSALVLLFDGAQLWLAADRLGQLGWWWAPAPGGLRFAAHPGALGGAAAAPLGPGGLLHVVGGGPPTAGRWWDPGAPPPGRAGARAGWDRAVDHALALGALRAAELGGGPAPAAPPLNERDLNDALDAIPALDLPGPALSSPTFCLLAQARGGPPGPLLPLPIDALLGEGLPRWAAGAAWTAARLALSTAALLPLGMAALARGGPLPTPSPLHPALLSALAKVPALHLVGLRQSLLRRRGAAPWAPPAAFSAWLEAPHPIEADPAARAAQGKPPVEPAARLVWRCAAVWAAGARAGPPRQIGRS
jgi:hypothetical protein